MNRGPKIFLLLTLLAGAVGCMRTLALGAETAWLPFASETAARFVFRLLMIGFGLGAWFISQSLIGARGCREGAIGDAVHDWTAGLHGWFVRHPRAANVVLMISSAFIDLFGVFMIAAALFGPTIRPAVGMLLLFAFRQISQLTCALPTPAGMIWRHPGFPSLLVTYDVANDFFFSGHTAIGVLGAIEVARIAPGWLAAVVAVIAFLEAATVLILRAHYTMDVLTAVVAAFCAAVLAARVTVGF